MMQDLIQTVDLGLGPDSLVDIDGLAEGLGIDVSKTWLRRQAIDGVIPSLQAGSKRLFSIKAVRSKLCSLAWSGGGATPAGNEPETVDDAA